MTNLDFKSLFVIFRDVYSLQSGPQQLEFGHVFEDPNVWEQRYEKKDFDAQRYQGKVSFHENACICVNHKFLNNRYEP